MGRGAEADERGWVSTLGWPEMRGSWPESIPNRNSTYSVQPRRKRTIPSCTNNLQRRIRMHRLGLAPLHSCRNYAPAHRRMKRQTACSGMLQSAPSVQTAETTAALPESACSPPAGRLSRS